jgi:hypothetical protein
VFLAVDWGFEVDELECRGLSDAVTALLCGLDKVFLIPDAI